MKSSMESVDAAERSARAVQSAAMALELNRRQLAELLAESRGGSRSHSAIGLLMQRVAGIDDIESRLRSLAEKHPYGVLAAGAAAGGIARLILPRLAAALVVPVLWSEGRQVVHRMLHGWLRAAGTGRRAGGAV